MEIMSDSTLTHVTPVNLFEDDSSESDKENQSPIKQVGKRGRPTGNQKTRETVRSLDGTAISPPMERLKVKSRLAPLLSLASVLCCDWMCLSTLAMREATICRESFQSMAQMEQKQWVLDFLRSHSTKTGLKFLYSFFVGSTKVCCIAWRMVLGLTQSRYYRVKQEFEGGTLNVTPPGDRRLHCHNPATQHALSWLENYVTSYADKLPTQDQLHLPSCLTKRDVYSTYSVETEEIRNDCISQAHFYRIWKRNFPHVHIPKVNRFAKCDKCTLLKTLLQETSDKAERCRPTIRERRQKHLRKQNEERRKYYKHSDKARKYPEKYMSVIIDGMDQSKTFTPHFVNVSKIVSSSWNLRTHLTGVLVHGHSPYAFFDFFQWPHSSNLTITVLLNILQMYKENLPPVLYLQMDNCGRENKNRFVFAFLCLLVENKIFDKIKVSFLMVGHTHEDIDQMFSRFSVWLSKHAALTLPKLISGFESCYKPRPTGIQLDKVYNFSEWVSPFLNPMSMHSKPHVFKIVRDGMGKAVISTKKWSGDNGWQECSGSENGCLLKSSITGFPKLLRPGYDHLELPRLKGDIQASYKFMGKEEDRKWWEDWFQEVELCSEELNDFDSSDDESWDLSQLRRFPVDNEVALPTPGRFADFDQTMSDEDSPIRPVQIGNRMRKMSPNNDKPLEVGDLCLLDMPKYADTWPQLAQVIAIEENNVTIKWYKGSIQSKIAPWVLLQRGAGRIDWEETVNRNLIWYHGFQLTAKGYIPSNVRKLLADYDDF